MAIADNKVVSMEYEVRDAATKEVIDSNKGQKPLQFITGKGQIIPGLENKIKEMNENEEADILVKAEDAYGQKDENAIQSLPIEQFAGIELYEGMTLYGQGESGETVQVTVQSFDNEEVVIDFNHPLAGKDLLFSVKIVDVRDATPEEIMSGYVIDPNESCGCGTGCGCH